MSRLLPFLTTLSFVALFGLAAEASAGPLQISNKLKNPTVTAKITVQVERYYLDNLGYSDCGSGSNTTKEPAFTFELTETMSELSVRFESPVDPSYPIYGGGVIAFPDGRHLCANKDNEVFYDKWTKGTYKVWLYGSSSTMNAVLRFEIPSKSKAGVDAARAAAPKIALGADRGVNPATHTVKTTASAEAADVGMGCVDRYQRIMPLARLEVAKAAHYYLGGAVPMFIVTPDDMCLKVDAGNELELAAGSHMLWGKVPKEGAPASFALEVDDRSRPLAFADAPKRPVGALAEPLVIDGVVRAAQRWPERNRCGGLPRDPDFYLTSDKPLQQVVISSLWSREPQRLAILGPLEKMESNWTVNCEYNSDDYFKPQHFEILEGTYAVWIGTDTRRQGNDATGDAYHLLVRLEKSAIDRMKSFAAVPADVAMDERPIANHFPFFDTRDATLDDWEALFTGAPAQLFVYPRIDVGDGDDGDGDDGARVKAGEPLLISWTNKETTSAIRYDGRHVQVKTQLLDSVRPATISLPDKPTVPAYDEVGTALEHQGPEDAKVVTAYVKQREKYDDCWYRYMEKNDPTWGTNSDVYTISGNGRVTNVSNATAKRADKKCGWNGVDKSMTKVVKELAKTRTARYAKELAAVRARFGL